MFALTLGLSALAVGLWLLSPDVAPLPTIIAFTLAVALGEFLAVDIPGSRPVPLAVAAVGALALLPHAPQQLVAVTIVGWLLACAVRRQRPSLLEGAERYMASVSVGLASITGALAAPELTIGPSGGGLHLLSIALVVGVVLVGRPLWSAATSEDASSPDAFAGEVVARVVASLRGNAALASAAVLAALVFEPLGDWSLVAVALPLLAARAGLNRAASAEVMYDQTVAAVSRASELAGAMPDGHGARVRALAEAMARDLGLGGDEIAAVERAALLHEIGRLMPDADEDGMAEAGAALASEAGTHPEVAELIARQREPYRVRLGAVREDVPVGARIIRTACEFDLIVASDDGTAAGDDPEWWALEVLHHQLAYDHDPLVLRSLAETVSRRRAFVA